MDITLQAKKRDMNIKPKNLRKDGWVPACVYGKEMEPINIQIPVGKLKAALQKHAKKLELSIEGGSKYLVGFEEIQKGPLGNTFEHISFHALNKNEKATLTIPVELTGKAIGQAEGGMITHLIHEVTVKGYPSDLPDSLQIDISKMEIGNLIHFSDIAGNYNFEFLAEDLDKAFVKCAHAKVVVLEEFKAEQETTEEYEEVSAEAPETAEATEKKAA